jgi:hypothetical protein
MVLKMDLKGFLKRNLKWFLLLLLLLLFLLFLVLLLLIHVVNEEDQHQDNVLVNQILVIYQEVVHVVNSRRRANARPTDENDYSKKVLEDEDGDLRTLW